MFPLGDDNPTRRRPLVTYALIALNVAAFLASLSARDPESVIRWTMVPADLHWPTLFTSLFLHANWIHLLGNMWFLWIFGDNVEDRMGRLGFSVFYLACGLAAAGVHIATNAGSDIPTLGASGAISGVMGAYVCFFPKQPIRTIFFVFIVAIPAYVWIGIWFLENFYLSTKGLTGGVAYGAHVGGFVAGAAIGAVIRIAADHWPSGRRDEPLEARAPERRLFAPIPDDPGIEYMDEPGDGYSVLRLSEDPADIGRIAPVVAAITNESPADVTARLQSTRGMIARAIPLEAAYRIQRELHPLGIPSAKVLHNRSNLPPQAIGVDSASWDDRALRLRAGDQIVMVPWSAPFLFVGARVADQAFVDVFVNRRSAYRILDARHVPLTEVDPGSRREITADLAGFARVVIDRAAGAAINEGVRAAASGAAGGRLDFRNKSDYDDYVFWVYTLTLAQGSSRRG